MAPAMMAISPSAAVRVRKPTARATPPSSSPQATRTCCQAGMFGCQPRPQRVSSLTLCRPWYRKMTARPARSSSGTSVFLAKTSNMTAAPGSKGECPHDTLSPGRLSGPTRPGSTAMSDLAGMNPTGRFSGLAELYARCRPDYPAAALDFVLSRCGLAPGALLVDVGCGTGIAARLFAGRGLRVVGVEPNADMRRRAEAEPLAPGAPVPL